jgi:outer membrane beta-barrel protein
MSFFSKARSRGGAAIALLAALGLSPAGALGDELEEGGKLYAVQNRKYLLAHEFTIGVGMIPLDAFYKGYTGTFAYTYHFSDLWAWEIVSASYSLNVETGLRRELMENFGVRPTKFPELNFFGDSNLVLKPFYGKMVYLNESLTYWEVFLTAGPAVSRYENAGVLIGLNGGLGFRMHLSKSFSIRLDLRDYFFVDPETFSDTKNELFFQLAVGLNVR